MMCQGTGGGYGDVLQRDPALVIKDLEESLISDETAREIYHVAYRNEIYGIMAGQPVKMDAANLQSQFMLNPKDFRIAELEKRG